MTEIIMQAYQVLDEIKQEETFLEMKRLDHVIPIKYKTEIELFQAAKKVYDDVMATGGSYHPDFKKAVKAFSEAKTILYAKEEVSTYFQLEKTLQDDINAFLKTLTDTVSTHIKTPNKLGIVQKGGSCHVR